MQETATNSAATEIPQAFQEPIILNPGLSEGSKKTSHRSIGKVFSTLGILLAGWFFGNLILLAIGSAGIAIAAGSTGLVKVPFVSERFFGTGSIAQGQIDQEALENAQEKLQAISNLAEGQVLKSVALDEEEINALLKDKVLQSNSFPIVDPEIKLKNNEFILTGKLSETNAPVEVVGKVEVSGLSANVEVSSAKFGKIQIPTFIASNLLESYLSQIGLSLSSTELPAKSLRIQDGSVSLVEVSKKTSD